MSLRVFISAARAAGLGVWLYLHQRDSGLFEALAAEIRASQWGYPCSPIADFGAAREVTR